MERDHELGKAIVAKAQDFWKQVKEGPAPVAFDPGDRRCAGCAYRNTCHGADYASLLVHFQDREGDPIAPEAAPELSGELGVYREAKALADEATAVAEETREALTKAIGDRQAVECLGVRIYYRTQVSKRIDTRALRSKYPAIAEELERPSVSRPLRIYGI